MPLRRWRLVTVALAALVLGACSSEATSERRTAIGAEVVNLSVSDGLTLDARYWAHSGDRIIIYLHEFREEQSSWWTCAGAHHPPGTSALTIDLRGHGDSEGLDTDVAGMVLDVGGAIAFVREAGYAHVMLAGAGLGGAVAIVAASTDPQVTVVGLSVPSEFGELQPLAAILETPGLAERVWLIASEDDISAADSLQDFREPGGVPYTRSHLFSGRAHGISLLDGDEATAVRRLVETVMAEFWVAVR